MVQFSYYNPTQIVFGKETEKRTGEYASKFGKKVLLHYGGGSIKRNGVYDRVVASLQEHGVSYVELGGVQPNPRLSLVREGIALCKKENVDLILAVGGGSAIDSAKAIAAGVLFDGDIWDAYIQGPHLVKAALPVGVVLTIPAAGSESSTGSVITNEDGWYKRSVDTELLIPKFAIINPETNYTLPDYQTACGCSDIMAHLMERYFTQVTNVDLSDRLIEAALQTMLHYAPLALEYPNDYDIRAEINWTGTIAHNNLLGCGRIGDWSSHKIEHELSGIYDIAHGAGLSIVFPAWMRYVYKDNIDRFVQFATRVMGVNFAMAHKEKTILAAIDKLESFYRSIGLPTRLSHADIPDDRLEEMAEKAVVHSGGKIGMFKELTQKDILEILKLAV